MQISLSTNEALEELEFLLILGKKPRFKLPVFVIETDFIDFFAHILERAPKRRNVIPYMDRLIAQAFDESVAEICGMLNQNGVDGTTIFELISDKKLIPTGVRKAYNKKLEGKLRKGLGTGPWRTYNNWLLAGVFWKAFVQSHDPHFKIKIREHEWPKAATETFYDRDYKALWATKEAYVEAGEPKHGYANKDIFIRPHAEWHFFIQKTREKHAALKKRLNSSKN